MACVKVLGTTCHMPAFEALLAWLYRPDEDLRREVVRALGKLRNPRAAPALIALLPGADSYLQFLIVKALGALGDARATGALLRLLDSASSDKGAALGALRELGWQPESPCQEALVAIAERHWERLLPLGRVAFEPLLRAIRCELSDDDRPQEMLGVLETLVERFGSELNPDDLLSCAGMEGLDVTRIEKEYDEKDSPIGQSTHTSVLSCARLRNLARRELRRRGVG